MGITPDYVLDIWPEEGYEHGREARELAKAWERFRPVGCPGMLTVGCDIAADPDDLEAMTRTIAQAPELVATGQVKLWPESTKRDLWMWSHRPGTLGNPAATQDGTAPVAYFSIGFAWLPARLLDLALPDMPSWLWGQTDVKLSELALAHGIGAVLVPDCRPKHLHFAKEHDGAAIRARAEQDRPGRR